jgi:hypothetical protein
MPVNRFSIILIYLWIALPVLLFGVAWRKHTVQSVERGLAQLYAAVLGHRKLNGDGYCSVRPLGSRAARKVDDLGTHAGRIETGTARRKDARQTSGIRGYAKGTTTP